MKYGRYIFALVLVMLFAACNSQRPTVRTSKKNPPKKTTQTAQRPQPKPAHKPVEPAPKPKLNENLEATSNVNVTTDAVADYIQQFKEIAKENMRLHKIPASITLAQGVLESGAGAGRLSQIANNHFGIKCHREWTGPSVKHDDDAAQECFRKYQHPSESYRDHSLFLTSRPRYNGLFQLPITDYAAWARGLRAAGYATDPKYPDKLISLIERYQLYKYDQEVVQEGKIVVQNPTKPQSQTTASSGKTHTVTAGDTLYSLSRKYNTTVEAIKQHNNLSSNNLSQGQLLIIP